MTTLEKTTHDTLADLLHRLGGIAPSRVRLRPPPGTATVADLTDEKPTCELVEGTLVEKAMGFRESLLAALLIGFLQPYLAKSNKGMASGADGVVRLLPNLARAPDVAVFSWSRLLERPLAGRAYPEIVPELAVEVLSESNTPGEMKRKRHEYFDAGVQLVWEIDPDARTVSIHEDAGSPKRILPQHDVLAGGEVLPGVHLPLKSLFSPLDRLGL